MSIYFHGLDAQSRNRFYEAADDGTGAQLFPDYLVSGGVSALGVIGLTHAFNGKLLFQGYSSGQPGSSGGQSLFISDGTAAGTTRLVDLYGAANAQHRTFGLGFVGDVGSRAFFTAYNQTTAKYELWSTNGTVAGTTQAGQLQNGTQANTAPGDFTVFNGRIYWTQQVSATSGVRELWTSDGTAVSQFYLPGGTGGNVLSAVTSGTLAPFLVVGSKLFFVAQQPGTADYGGELYVTDGTTAGTMLVKDINSGSPGSNPTNFVALNGKLLFSANTSGGGNELYASDGTSAGTVLLKDITSDGASGSPGLLTLAGSQVFFTATQPYVTGTELWVTNGVTAGTHLVKDIAVGGADAKISSLVVLGDKVVFAAADAVSGSEVWVSDGTATGTIRLTDTLTGAASGFQPLGSSDRSADLMVASEGLVYFTALTAANGDELWVTDGTLAGTHLVRDINPLGSSDIVNLKAVKGGVAFSAYDAGSGREAWFSDGTAAGTHVVFDAVTGSATDPSYLNNYIGIGLSGDASTPLRVGDNLVFAATLPGLGRELWVLDGGSQGAHLLADIGEGGLNGVDTYWNSQPSGASTSGTGLSAFVNPSTLVFRGNDATHGAEVWITDGTSAGTHLLKDVAPGATSANVQGFKAFAGRVYFTATTLESGAELWATDGTEAGTVMVADIQPNFSFAPTTGVGSTPTDLIVAGSNLFFTAGYTNPSTYAGTGVELWVTDGTAAGAHLTKDIFPADASSQPSRLTAFGDRLVFAANDGTSGQEPWISDGTAAGTFRLADVAAGSAGSNPSDFIVSSGKIFFSATSSATGTELWVSDGTVAGTGLVKDIQPGVASGGVYNAFSYGGRLFFNTIPAPNQNAFWSSDGTTAGTYQVNALPSGKPYFLNGSVLFTRTGAAYGTEIFVGSGDLTNATMLGNFSYDTTSATPQTTIVGLYAGKLLFYATDSLSKTYYYTTDGTAAGTVKLGLVSSYTPNAAAFDAVGAYSEVADSAIYIDSYSGGQELFARGPTGVITRLTDVHQPRSSNPADFVSVVAADRAPALAGAGPVGPVGDHGAVSPFAAVGVVDADPPGRVLSIKITPAFDGAGTFTPASLAASGFVQATDGSASFTGAAAQVEAALHALVFTPSVYVAVAGATASLPFTVLFSDGVTASTNSAVVLSVTGTDDPAGAPDLTAATDSGVLDTDDLTNAATPAFTGRADAGAAVQIRDGAATLATVTANAQGFYSYSAALGEGTHGLTAVAPGGASPVLNLVVDRTNAAVNAPGSTFAHGAIFTITTAMLGATDANSTAAQIRYTLTADDAKGILLLSGSSLGAGQSFTQADVDAGRISYVHGAVQLGDDLVPISVTDAAGNVRASAGLVLTATNAPPVAVADVVTVVGTGVVSATTRATGVIGNDTDADAYDIANNRLVVNGVRTGAGSTGFATLGGPLAGAYGSLTIGGDGSYSYTPNGTVAGLTSPQTDVFSYRLTDSFATSATTLTFRVGPQGSAPTLSASPPAQPIDDTEALAAFASITVGDANASATSITLTAVLDTGAYGTLTHLGAGAYDSASRTYTVVGTAAQVSAALDGVVFTPFANVATPGAVYDVGFTLKATNSFGEATSAQPVVVRITSINDAPVTPDDVNTIQQRLSIPGDVRANDSDVDHLDVIRITGASFGGGPTVTVPNAPRADITGAYGVLHLSYDGKYVYEAISEGLAVGASVIDDFLISVVDMHDATSSEHLRITVTGSPNGDARANVLVGGAGADALYGFAGADTLVGGGGDDTLDGGVDVDTAIYSGPRSAYAVVRSAPGVVQVTDTRSGSPDGTDTLVNVERLQFSDYTRPALLTLGSDYDGAGRSDLLFRNSNGGGIVAWDGASSSAATGLGGVGTEWSILTGDLEGDGKTDIVFRNTSGGNVVWNGGVASTAHALTAVEPVWKLLLTGDFDGDGKADLLFRNDDSGALVTWKGGDSTQAAYLGGVGPEWVIKAGDFDGDGRTDLIFRNTAGGNVVWDGGVASTAHALTQVDPVWSLAAVGDFDGDGKADLAFLNTSTGAVVTWSAGNSASAVFRGTTVTNAQVLAGDFNGDGYSDLFLLNPSTGALIVWDGAASSTAHTIGGVGSEWQVFG